MLRKVSSKSLYIFGEVNYIFTISTLFFMKSVNRHYGKDSSNQHLLNFCKPLEFIRYITGIYAIFCREFLWISLFTITVMAFSFYKYYRRKVLIAYKTK